MVRFVELYEPIRGVQALDEFVGLKTQIERIKGNALGWIEMGRVEPSRVESRRYFIFSKSDNLPRITFWIRGSQNHPSGIQNCIAPDYKTPR